KVKVEPTHRRTPGQLARHSPPVSGEHTVAADDPAFHRAYSSGRHTAHGRCPAATAVCWSAKNTRFLTYPPRAMARSAAGQSSLPYTRPGREPPRAPGVARWQGWRSGPSSGYVLAVMPHRPARAGPAVL